MPATSLKRLAPYRHADGSDCYTKNCSKNIASVPSSTIAPTSAAEFFATEDLAKRERKAMKALNRAMESVFGRNVEESDPSYTVGKIRRRMQKATDGVELAEIAADALPKLEYGDSLRVLRTLAESKVSSAKLLMTLVKSPNRVDVISLALSNPNLKARNLLSAHEALYEYVWHMPNGSRGLLWAAIVENPNANSKVLHAVAQSQSAESDQAIIEHKLVSTETLQYIRDSRRSNTYAYQEASRRLGVEWW
jgi:hypothetical protein